MNTSGGLARTLIAASSGGKTQVFYIDNIITSYDTHSWLGLYLL